MELTMSQIGDKMQYTMAQREEVRWIAEFVGLFYARWFIMSAKSESMPLHGMLWLPFTSWGSTEASILTLLRQDWKVEVVTSDI